MHKITDLLQVMVNAHSYQYIYKCIKPNPFPQKNPINPNHSHTNPPPPKKKTTKKQQKKTQQNNQQQTNKKTKHKKPNKKNPI